MKKLGLLLFIFGLGSFFFFSHKPSTHKVMTFSNKKLFRPQQKSVEPVFEDNKTMVKFNTLIADTFNTLPKVEDFKDRHGFDTTPREIIRASKGLSEIHDSIKTDKTLANLGYEFYRACAVSEDFVMPVRAICLRDFAYWANALDDKNRFKESDFPDEVLEISKRLPPPF